MSRSASSPTCNGSAKRPRRDPDRQDRRHTPVQRVRSYPVAGRTGRGVHEPRASVVVLSGNRPDAIVTVAWEISWYQYRVEAEHGGHVRLEDRGDDPGA